MDKHHREALAAVRDEVGRRAHVTIQRGSKHYQILMSDGPTGEGEIGRITLGTGPRVAMHARAEARRLMKAWRRPLPGAEVTKVWVDEARYMADPAVAKVVVDGVHRVRSEALGTTAIATGAVYDRRQEDTILGHDTHQFSTHRPAPRPYANLERDGGVTLHGIGYEVDRQYRVGEREIQELLSKVDYSGIEERVRAWAESASPEELARWLEGDFTPYLPETTVSGGGTQAPEETAMNAPLPGQRRTPSKSTGQKTSLDFTQRYALAKIIERHCRRVGEFAVYDPGHSDESIAASVDFRCSHHNVATIRKDLIGNFAPRSTASTADQGDRLSRLERALAIMAREIGANSVLVELGLEELTVDA